MDSEAVLILLFLGDDDSFGGIDSFVDLEAQEVLDFECLHRVKYYFASIDNIDNNGEMGISKDHLELVADTDSVHHVPDDALDGAEDSVSLLLLEPHSELDAILSALLYLFLLDLEGDVLEGFGDFAEWP